jgi:hypothetical protein
MPLSPEIKCLAESGNVLPDDLAERWKLSLDDHGDNPLWVAIPRLPDRYCYYQRVTRLGFREALDRLIAMLRRYEADNVPRCCHGEPIDSMQQRRTTKWARLSVS